MQEQTVVIKVKDGDLLNVSKYRLIADSNIFRYLLEELGLEQLEIEDFSVDIVTVFLTLLEDKQVRDIEKSQFRELHKLSVVFEVMWLKNNCQKWLNCKMTRDKAMKDEEKFYLLEECFYIQKKWGQSDLMNTLLSTLVHQDNSTIIAMYMPEFDKLEPMKLDVMLILGGSDTFCSSRLFFRIC